MKIWGFQLSWERILFILEVVKCTVDIFKVRVVLKRSVFVCPLCPFSWADWPFNARTLQLCPEMHLALNLGTSYKPGLFVVFI